MKQWMRNALAAVAAVAAVALVIGGASTAVAADRELIANGTFSNGHSPWWNTNNFAFATSTGAYCADVPAGLAQYQAIVGQHGLAIDDGASYTLTFSAWSSTATTIRAQVQPKANPDLITYVNPVVTLDGQRRTFSFTFTPDLTSPTVESSLQFRLGGNPASKICIDDVSLTTPETTPEPVGPDELLVNSTFDTTVKPWWSSGGTSMSVETGELCIEAGASANLWSLLVGQNSIYLPGDTRYRLSFDVRASKNVTNGVQVGPFHNPSNTAYVAKQFAVGTASTHYSYDFETTFDDPYALSQLQFRVGGSTSAYTVCYDNISLNGTAYAHVTDPGPAVKVNQVGYVPLGPKNATVVSDAAGPLGWELLKGGAEVATGQTVPAGLDPSAGVEVHTIDFSTVTETGQDFRLRVGDAVSHPFAIDEGVFQSLRQDALRFFYTNRSGIAIDGGIAGAEYARPAGHIGVAPNQGDTAVGCQKPKPWMDDWTCDYRLDVTGGWYDAGDHGKYVVNGGIAVAQLLGTWERAVWAGTDDKLGDSTLAVPERDNGIPDILDEARWELDFLLKMQVPDGEELAGMAHHKVQDETWTGLPLLPSADAKPRQLHRPSTAATLNLAAVAAQGARLFELYDAGYAATLLAAAERAYEAAAAHPTLLANREDGAEGGGAYADDHVGDEFYWAAAELYLTTNAQRYVDDIEANPLHTAEVFTAEGFYWGSVAPLARLELARFAVGLDDIERIRAEVIAAADRLMQQQDEEPFGQPYAPEGGSYVWGSNSSILNNQVVLATAFDLTDVPAYARAVLEGYDYLLGRNVIGQSYITGYGENDAVNQHSRWYARSLDPGLPNPPIGSVAGGPNSALQDPLSRAWLTGCAPQACYVDNIEAWAVNEITVNWNSALTWVASFVADLGDGARSADAAVAAPAQGVLSHDNGWDTGLRDGEYGVTMNLWWGENATTFRLYEDDRLVGTYPLVYAGQAAQAVTVPITGRANGAYVYTGELTNSRGTTRTAPVTVTVDQAAPGAVALSHDNTDGDGEYTLSADLWWGTNATTYRLLEDGAVIAEGDLVARTPNAQRATVLLKGRLPGAHTYVVEFSNSAGTTASAPVTVTVSR